MKMKPKTNPTILAIESSCDDTAVAIWKDGSLKSNIIASQEIHKNYGGVIPELASRAHMQHIVPTTSIALKDANIALEELDAIAYTQTPGLMGSLLVGASFGKSLAQSLSIPSIPIHHLQAHILAHFIAAPKPDFPFLCLTVSGGHTQLVLCNGPLEMRILGSTIDDAAGEAFDKVAKMLGFPYPGGPYIDKYAQNGNPNAFLFPIANVPDFDYSFSGIKTAVMYFLQREVNKDPNFIENNIEDICASVQYTIIKTLLQKLSKAQKQYKIKHIGIAGGVSANSGLRKAFKDWAEKKSCESYIPDFEYCTDNAGMIAVTAYYKYLAGDFGDLRTVPKAKSPIPEVYG
ncbi:MAG TPA: tRNA (adenosine(37)-N6)-threonylcarbamoyltransferase complex transferase subunit TsaD [Chitinophagaceae bacterium]|nr:tRNA (adenosine(37)-N6)-threonylcarbamoyltransferase complex transferase subunit TsaD [Chitinophagaceae bacterium]